MGEELNKSIYINICSPSPDSLRVISYGRRTGRVCGETRMPPIAERRERCRTNRPLHCHIRNEGSFCMFSHCGKER